MMPKKADTAPYIYTRCNIYAIRAHTKRLGLVGIRVYRLPSLQKLVANSIQDSY